MENNNILLTIAIPTFGRSEKLKQQLCDIHQSLLHGQISSNIEVLVSDNHSIDETSEIIRNFDLLDKKYLFTCNKNVKNFGFDTNLMIACLKSSGRFIWTLGDDDKLEEGAIEFVYSLLEKNLNIGCGFINYYTGSSSKNVTAIPFVAEYSLTEDIGSFVEKTRIKHGFFSSCLYRRDLLSKDFLGQYIGTAYPHLYWVACIAKNYSSIVINKPLIEFHHPGGVIESRKKSNKREVHHFDYYLFAHLNFLKFISFIQSSNIPLKLRFNLYRISSNQNLNQIIFHKITVKNYDTIAIKSALKVMVKKFYFSPIFWLIHVPILILPCSFAKFIEPYRWKYIDYRHKAGAVLKSRLPSIFF